MEYFNKKNLIIIITSLILIIIICVYFFTQKNSNSNLILNDLFVEDSSVDTQENEQITIHIAGEINNPGVFYLSPNSRIIDAINAAGGSTDIANLDKINLAYKLQDGQKIYIPSIYDEEISNYITNNSGDNVLDSSSNINTTININTATQSELETLPGIGEATAQKIIDYRNRNGKFHKVEDIMNVSGIGESKFNNIKDKISV